MADEAAVDPGPGRPSGQGSDIETTTTNNTSLPSNETSRRVSAILSSNLADLQISQQNSAQSVAIAQARAFQVQRKNLLHMFRICIRRLVESGLQMRHQLDDSCETIRQFCVLMDHVMRHGLKVKRTLLGGVRQCGYWPYLKAGLAGHSTALESLFTISNLPNLSSDPARCRAWIRLSLMEKRLAEYFTLLGERLDTTNEWYEEWSVIRNEEGSVLAGLLLSLNAIDANLDLRAMDLNDPETIDFTQYIGDGHSVQDGNPMASCCSTASQQSDHEQDNRNTQLLLNQKQFAEELASKLRSQLEAAHRTIDELRTEMTQYDRVVAELARTRSDMAALKIKHAESLKAQERSASDERTTFKESLVKMERMYQSMQKQFETEMAMRIEVERDYAFLQNILSQRESRIEELERELHEARAALASPARSGDILSESIETHHRVESSAPRNTISATSANVSTLGSSKPTLSSTVPPQSTPSAACPLCNQAFKIDRRKQQCRVCKTTACSECVHYFLQPPGAPRAVRACKNCVEAHNNTTSTQPTTDLD